MLHICIVLIGLCHIFPSSADSILINIDSNSSSVPEDLPLFLKSIFITHSFCLVSLMLLNYNGQYDFITRGDLAFHANCIPSHVPVILYLYLVINIIHISFNIFCLQKSKYYLFIIVSFSNKGST